MHTGFPRMGSKIGMLFGMLAVAVTSYIHSQATNPTSQPTRRFLVRGPSPVW
jgi:hypothetical protein